MRNSLEECSCIKTTTTTTKLKKIFLTLNDLYAEKRGDRFTFLFSLEIILCGWLSLKHQLTNLVLTSTINCPRRFTMTVLSKSDACAVFVCLQIQSIITANTQCVHILEFYVDNSRYKSHDWYRQWSAFRYSLQTSRWQHTVLENVDQINML